MECNFLGLLILLCAYIKEVQLQVTLTLATSRPTFTQQVELRCTYTGAAACCNSNRIWTKDGVSVMTNGVSALSSKYEEEINANAKYFTLKIKNFELSDLGKPYTCQYGFVISSALTLLQDPTFIYPATELCPMTNDKRHIYGTLNVTKCQPSPTFLAYYKDKNWTSLLSKTTPVLYDTFYYTALATLNLPDGLTCGDGEIFTFTVVTGTVETTICTVDYCRCNFCVLWYFLWSLLGTGIVVIVVMSGIFIKVKSLAKLTLRQKLLPGVIMFFSSAVLNLCLAVPLGLKICACIDDTAPLFILLGIGTCSIIAAVIIRCKKPDDEDKAEMLFMVGEYAIFILAWCVCTRDKKQEPPSKPEGPLKVDHNKNSVTIKWKAPKRGMPLTQYIIKIGVATMKPGNKATWKDIAIVKPENETYTIENLEENDYFFRVSAKNAVGVGEPLETDKPVHIPNEPPSKPEGPLIVDYNKNSVTIKWKAPKRGMPLTQYIIQIGVVTMKPGNKATWKDIAIVKPEKETCTIENLEENDYFFRVSAKNAVGVGEPLETDKPVHIPNDEDTAVPPKSAGRKLDHGKVYEAVSQDSSDSPLQGQ